MYARSRRTTFPPTVDSAQSRSRGTIYLIKSRLVFPTCVPAVHTYFQRLKKFRRNSKRWVEGWRERKRGNEDLRCVTSTLCLISIFL